MIISNSMAIKLLEIFNAENKNQEWIISELCKLSLNTKWYIDSHVNIDKMCPFCYFSAFASNINIIKEKLATYDDIFLNQHCNCKACLCPKEICNNTGQSGYINTLENLDILYISSLLKEDLNRMIVLFEKYIIKEVK